MTCSRRMLLKKGGGQLACREGGGGNLASLKCGRIADVGEVGQILACLKVRRGTDTGKGGYNLHSNGG